MTGRAGQQGRKRDKPREARLIVDAKTFGNAGSAKRNGVSVKSVQRALGRVAADPELAALVSNLSSLADLENRTQIAREVQSWHTARTTFLVTVFGAMTAIATRAASSRRQKGDGAFLRALADAAEKGGSLDIAHGALNGSDAGDEPDSAG